MNMTPGLRKLALTAHVISSVGWLGAIVGFLALAVASLTSHDVQLVRASHLAMRLMGWYVIVPLKFASLLTGLISSFRHEVGLVSALLGYVQVSNKPFCQRHVADVYADTGPLRTRGGRCVTVGRRSQYVA